MAPGPLAAIVEGLQAQRVRLEWGTAAWSGACVLEVAARMALAKTPEHQAQLAAARAAHEGAGPNPFRLVGAIEAPPSSRGVA